MALGAVCSTFEEGWGQAQVFSSCFRPQQAQPAHRKSLLCCPRTAKLDRRGLEMLHSPEQWSTSSLTAYEQIDSGVQFRAPWDTQRAEQEIQLPAGEGRLPMLVLPSARRLHGLWDCSHTATGDLQPHHQWKGRKENTIY